MANEHPVAANYEYWRRHGAEWTDEYDRRKQLMPAYHIQELMLLDYFARQAPARVLEFGCGVGRHLRYLRQVPGLDVFGYDQSATMVQQCERWADPTWLAEHVKVGAPVGSLPYADASFDIVYTTEALVHVCPDDLPEILRELRRICVGHLLHLETAPAHTVRGDAHEGSWKHDLVETYREIGLECVQFEQGYGAHVPHLVTVGGPVSGPPWSSLFLAHLRRLEEDLVAGISELQGRLAGMEARCAELEKDVARARADSARASDAMERERARVGALLGERERFLSQALAVVRR